MQGHAVTKNRSFLIPMLFFLLCFGVLLAGFTSNLNLKLSPHLLYHHLFWPFGKLVLYLGVGLFIGQAMESLGWSARFRRQGPAFGELGPLWLRERGCLQRLFLFRHFSEYHVDELLSGWQTQPPGTDPQLSAEYRVCPVLFCIYPLLFSFWCL